MAERLIPIDADVLAQGMTRRRALASLAGTTAGFLWAAGCGPVAAQGSTFTPEMFGARGDGRTDDYPALQRLAAAVSAAGGGIVRFGSRRHYLIARFQTRGGPGRVAVPHIAFIGCRGIQVDLNGSTIEVKGDFHRGREGSEGRASHSSALIPLLFVRCTDVAVRDGILNGNVDRMTRDPRIVEDAGHGISLLGCRRVVLEGLHIHHFSTDGIRIGVTTTGEEAPCEDVRLNEVRLTNNARQGFTNAGGVRVVATECVFAETGLTGGQYGRHAPSAGVDVEPPRLFGFKSDFRAVRCRFDDNLGGPLIAGNPDRIASVELINCSGRAPGQRRLILSAERGVISGGTWHNIQIACAYAARRSVRTPISIDVSGGTWSGDDPNWAPVYDVNPRRPSVRIHNNRFQLLSRQPFVPTFLFLCANPDHRFEENEVFVSRAGHAGAGVDFVGQFRGAALVRGNRWSTDARPPLRFVNNYQDARRVEQETFSGSFGAAGRRG